MDFFTNRYYKYNRLLFVILGQWPYQNYKTRVFRAIIVFFYFGVALFGQIFKLTKATDFDLIFEILVSFLSNIVCTIRYCNCMVYVNEILKVFEDIKDVWDTTVVKEEIDIVKHYAEEGRMYTLFLIVFSYATLGFVDLASLIPCVLDIVVPLNDTRPRKFLYQAEFFLDTEKYFYPILLHTWITMFFGVTILVATESIFLMYAQHCCSMFKILCYRLEHAFDKNLENTDAENAYYEARERIVYCVKYHTKILEFITNVVSFHELSFFIQFLISVLILSITLVQVKTLLGKYEVLMYLTLTGALLCHGFLFAYPAQKILDHSSLLFENICNGAWYFAPIKAQKLLLLIIKRSMNGTAITAMKILVVSYQSFGTVVKTSLSYFTVLYSFR
ncbi:hypothetical protein KPH14_010014 [Odynerus spinipes]|uniref:Odorant receptor n=1 Tax=Odynerus spinipes TaxID=1348599 RepID=A0AAD9VSE9_9HYME|nr:hypothetical protein KPH14_010014 [Odynerus spinipes]